MLTLIQKQGAYGLTKTCFDSITIINNSITTILVSGFLQTSKQQGKRQLSELSGKYDSLYAAKVKSDTIFDTVFATKISKPTKVYLRDTVYLDDTLPINSYSDSLVDTNVHIKYAFKTIGWLLGDVDVQYSVFNKTITNNTIEYIEKPKPVFVEKQRRHLYIQNSIGSDLTHFNASVVYTTKNRLSYNVGYLLHDGDGFFTIGFGYRIF